MTKSDLGGKRLLLLKDYKSTIQGSRGRTQGRKQEAATDIEVTEAAYSPGPQDLL